MPRPHENRAGPGRGIARRSAPATRRRTVAGDDLEWPGESAAPPYGNRRRAWHNDGRRPHLSGAARAPFPRHQALPEPKGPTDVRPESPPIPGPFAGRRGIGAGFAIGGTKSSGRVIGANDTIRIGVAGLNGRGGSHVDEFGKMKGVEITYLIDPDTRTYGKRLDQIKKLGGGSTPKTVQDVRQALDDKNLDAISIATPNHWHALMTIWACQAGKDVYVEKPCSHNVHEGRVAVEAARKYDRIVQHGTQSRSDAPVGRPRRGRQVGHSTASSSSPAGSATSPARSIGVKPDTDAPEQVDFNLWLGPAPEQPVQRQLRPLQLALVLGLRQRRHRQPGRPPDGHRPLDDPRRHPAEDAS